MMPFSRSCVYGIRAMSYLAGQPCGRLIGVQQISQHEGIPAPYLSKVLLDLRRCHLLRSRRGTGGGFELFLPPAEITLLMIVNCLEGNDIFTRCILADQACDHVGGCILHEKWFAIRNQLIRSLGQISLAKATEIQRLKREKPPSKTSLEIPWSGDCQGPWSNAGSHGRP